MGTERGVIWEAVVLWFFKEGAGMRLINADEIQYAKDWVVTDKIPKVGGYNAKAIYRVTKEEIDAMPTVDAVPVVHSEWIPKEKTNTPYGLEMECAKCGFSVIVNDALYFKFCPNCGAKMDGKNGETA